MDSGFSVVTIDFGENRPHCIEAADSGVLSVARATVEPALSTRALSGWARRSSDAVSGRKEHRGNR